MAACILYDSENNPVNIIVADLDSPVPAGFRLELMPDNAIWDGKQIIIQEPIVDEVIE